MLKGTMFIPEAISPGLGDDGAEQIFGFGADAFASTILQIVVGRAQSEEPATGVYHPVDEGLC